MRWTVVTLLLLVGGAAAALAQPAPAKQNLPKTAAAKQTPQQNGNCVGVVSNLGEKFTVRKIGYTVFGNEINDVPVDLWQIDDLVVAKISAALGKRMVVRRIPYRREAFASHEALKLFHDTEAEIREAVGTLTAGTRCTRYLLVTRADYSVGTSNQTIGGIGILRTGIGELFTKVTAYAIFSLRLYDGETFTLLKRASAPSDESIWVQPIRGPHRQVDESLWPESPHNAAQNAKLREAIRELVSQGMDATLPELPL
jgi:hypothetical protein